MDTKNLFLGVFVILTVLFASLTLGEYFQVSTLNAQLQSKSTQALTSTITITSTAQCPSNTACGTFTYTPRGQVQVDSVQAIIAFPLGSGQQDITFAVTLENTGNSPIHFPSYALSSSIATNSTVAREVCNCGLSVSEDVVLNHGQNFTLYDPSSGNGYFYALLKGGTVDVTFSFDWTPGIPANTPSSSTTVSAQFIFTPPAAA